MALFNLCPGHGAADSGATGPNNRLEKNDNLRISLAVGAELEKRGHSVRHLRVDDSINNSASVCRDWLEKNPADFSIVFHRNAYNGKAYGVEVWSFDSDSLSTNIASDMSAAIANASGMSNRGRKGNGASWLSPNVRCIEPEIGFTDNASDNERFDMSFDNIVKAICDTLEKWFGKVELPQESEPTENVTNQTETVEEIIVKLEEVCDSLRKLLNDEAEISELNNIIEDQTQTIQELTNKIEQAKKVLE